MSPHRYLGVAPVLMGANEYLSQVSQRYSVELLEDPSGEQVEELAAMLGLRRVLQLACLPVPAAHSVSPQVGWIFTDLEQDARKKTMVAYKRSIVSYWREPPCKLHH